MHAAKLTQVILRYFDTCIFASVVDLRGKARIIYKLVHRTCNLSKDLLVSVPHPMILPEKI